MMLRRTRPAKPKPKPFRRPKLTWLTTWRRLLHRSTFQTLDELLAFFEDLGLHNGEIPTLEAFRRGVAKSNRGKFYWHLGKCTQLLRSHGKYEEINKDDYEPEK